MLTRVPLRRDTGNVQDGLSNLFFARLKRLVDLRPEPGLLFDAECLLHHAIYATYVDCRDLGLEQPASALVARIHRHGTPGR
jgi:hypothetical protein